MTSKSANRKSILLDNEQNNIVLSQLGHKCLSLSTTLAVLSVTIPPDHVKWKMRCSGVACFVKDYTRRTFFVRIYDLKLQRLVWDRNLCDVLDYNEVNPLYHVMKLDNEVVGLNFTNESEAAHFNEVVQEKLSIRTRQNDDSTAISLPNQTLYPNLSKSNATVCPLNEIPKINSEQTKIMLKTPISKPDISFPYNFNHVYHIGFNSNTNDLESTKNVLSNENLLNFLKSTGFSDEQLKDKKTIYDFFDKNGGIDKAIEFSGSKTGNDITITKTHRPAPPPPPKTYLNLKSQTDDEKIVFHNNINNDHMEDNLPPTAPPHSNIANVIPVTSNLSDSDNEVPPSPPMRTTSKFYKYEELLEEIDEDDDDSTNEGHSFTANLTPDVTIEHSKKENEHEDEISENAKSLQIVKPTIPPPLEDFEWHHFEIERKESVNDIIDEKFNAESQPAIIQKPVDIPVNPIRKAPPVPAPRKRNNKSPIDRESIYQNQMDISLATRSNK